MDYKQIENIHDIVIEGRNGRSLLTGVFKEVPKYVRIGRSSEPLSEKQVEGLQGMIKDGILFVEERSTGGN